MPIGAVLAAAVDSQREDGNLIAMTIASGLGKAVRGVQPADGNPQRATTQLYGVSFSVVYDEIVSPILVKLVDPRIDRRFESDVEREGLDWTVCGEAVR